MVKGMFPLAAIGADVIAGFPGEGEKEFLETFELMREQPLTHFHVFPFSRRKNTTAAKLPGQVSSVEKKQRVRTLIMLGQAKLDAFARDTVGQRASVLFESQKDGHWEGYTPHFLRVRMRSDEVLANTIRPVFLKAWNGTTLEAGAWLP
jgi:threonylcarbamoyladenosine tRNA methylthiotransferase MtaB